MYSHLKVSEKYKELLTKSGLLTNKQIKDLARFSWSEAALFDMTLGLLKDCGERLKTARNEFAKQQITIRELKQRSVFREAKHTIAPPDYKKEYLEMLEQRRKDLNAARKAERENS